MESPSCISYHTTSPIMTRHTYHTDQDSRPPTDEQRAADLLATLDTRGLDHLNVDDHRTVVCSREAVLDCRVTDGTLTAARAFTVASQGIAHWVREPDPAAVHAAFYRELVAAIDTAC